MDISEIKYDLENKGWTVFKNFLTKKDTSKYKKIIFSYLKNNHLKFKGRDINYVDNSKDFNKIHSLHALQECSEIKNFFLKGRLFKLSYLLFGNLKPELRASELFKKPKEKGLKAPPHQDDFFWNVKGNKGFTFWIALDDANKKNGSVYYFNSSHKLGLVPHVPTYSKGTSQTVKNKKLLKKFKKEYLNLNRGDMAIHSSLIVHGSEENYSKDNRAGWTFCVKPQTSPYDKKRTNNFKKSLTSQLKLREKNARI